MLVCDVLCSDGKSLQVTQHHTGTFSSTPKDVLRRVNLTVSSYSLFWHMLQLFLSLLYIFMSVGSSEHGMLLLLLGGTVDHQSSVWGTESQ